MRSGSSQIARNVLVTLGTQLITWGLSFLVTLWLPGYLGQRGLGMFGLATAFGSSLWIVIDMGTASIMVKEVARDHGRLAELVTTTFVLRIGLSLLAVPLGVGAAYLLHYDALQIHLIFLGLCATALGQLTLVFVQALQGLEDFPRSNAAVLADKVLSSLIMISLVHFRQPLWMFVTAPIFGTIAASCVAFTGILSHERRHHPHTSRWRLPGGALRPVGQIAGPVIVGILLFVLVEQLERWGQGASLNNNLHLPLHTAGILVMAGILIVAGLTFASMPFRTSLLALPPEARPKKKNLLAMLHAGLPIMTGMILFAIWDPGNKVLLSKLSSIEAVSWYELAKRLGGTAMVIPVALVGATLPTLSRIFHTDPLEFQRLTARLMRLLLICVVPFSCVLLFAAEPLLAVLHYLPKFHNTIPVLQGMGCGIVLWFISQVAAGALIASDQQKAFGRITGVAAVACLPLCATCILIATRLWHNGALGAVIGDVLIETGMLTGYLRILPRGLMTWVDLTILARATVAVLPLVWLLHRIHSTHEIYLAIPGILLYPILCLLFKCLDTQDLRVLRQSRIKSTQAA